MRRSPRHGSRACRPRSTTCSPTWPARRRPGWIGPLNARPPPGGPRQLRRHRRPEICADVEAIIGCEQHRNGHWHLSTRHLRAIDLQLDVQWTGWLLLGVDGLDFDLDLAGWDVLLRAEPRSLNLEEVVFVAEFAAFYVGRESARKRPQRIEHAVGIAGNLGINGNEIVD